MTQPPAGGGVGWSVRHGAHVDVPAHAEKGRTCRSGGSSQSRVDILLATTTTGQRLDFKQPCCLRLTAANPIPQRPPSFTATSHYPQQATDSPPRGDLGVGFFLPLQPCSETPPPFHQCLLPPIHAAGLAVKMDTTKYLTEDTGDAGERPETISPDHPRGRVG